MVACVWRARRRAAKDPPLCHGPSRVGACVKAALQSPAPSPILRWCYRLGRGSPDAYAPPCRPYGCGRARARLGALREGPPSAGRPEFRSGRQPPAQRGRPQLLLLIVESSLPPFALHRRSAQLRSAALHGRAGDALIELSRAARAGGSLAPATDVGAAGARGGEEGKEGSS
eukprot:364231-Chlamydomonas_euryale.AAC.3